MLRMEDNVGGESRRGWLGEDADEIKDLEWIVLGTA